MNGYNAKGEKHGLWVDYYPSLEITFRGKYENNIRVGYWEIICSGLYKEFFL